MDAHLTVAQLAAITTGHPRQLVLAGPGAGKTMTIVNRIRHLLTEGEPGENIVVITFTNSAAREIHHRLERDGHSPRLGYTGTLHGYALRELQAHGHRIGYRSRIKVLDAERAERMLTATLKNLGIKPSTKALEEALAFRGIARRPVEIAGATYRRALKEQSAVDFDTILTAFLELLEHMRTPIGHLIVDEFQDSGTADFEIYRRLNAQHRFFVGDPDQAIYGFRGGRLENILELAQTWPTIRLEQNFRSLRKICEAATALIGHNSARVRKGTFAARAGRGEITEQAFPTAEAEAQAIAGLVTEKLRLHEPEEIAVMCRTNAQRIELETTLRLHGVPVPEKKKSSKPKDWRLACLSLELLHNPADPMTAQEWVCESKDYDIEDFRRRATAAQLHSVAPFIPGLKTNSTAGGLPQDLARLGISRESIELMVAHRDTLINPDLGQILFAVATAREENPREPGVTVSTIHGAKGMEFSTVIVAGCEQEQFGNPEEREELRRLFFVAITRAKDELILTHAAARRQSWGRKEHAPATRSQFLDEIKPAFFA